MVHKLATFSSKPSKVNFEALVHLLRYIRDIKTLGLNYYVDMNDLALSDLLRQVSIKTENQLMAFSDSSWKYFPDTGRITGAYIIFYQGGPIDHGTHVPGPVFQSSVEIDYHAACTEGLTLVHFRVIIHEFLNKDPDIVPERAPLIIFCSKSSVCLVNNS